MTRRGGLGAIIPACILGRMGGNAFGFRRWVGRSTVGDSSLVAELQRSDSQYEEWDLIPAPIRPAKVARGDIAGAYWRRRFAVLIIGLLAFGLAAWGLSSALAVHPHAPGHSQPGHKAGALAGQPPAIRGQVSRGRRARDGQPAPGGGRSQPEPRVAQDASRRYHQGSTPHMRRTTASRASRSRSA